MAEGFFLRRRSHPLGDCIHHSYFDESVEPLPPPPPPHSSPPSPPSMSWHGYGA